MNELDAVAALQARGRFGVRLGLGRTRALLAQLGDPHKGLRGALIGGTNGKGSTQALVGAALRAGGYRVGQTPKPHLVSYRERIVVDGEHIAASDFGPLVEEVLAAADKVPARHGPPTEFELVTAAAFTWFARVGVEVAVVEVGLGGRLDATNVWDGGVAAITNVDLDHMEWLGPTVPLIAREKAAIIKRGDLAVTGADGDALDVIQAAARRAGAPLEVTAPLPVASSTTAGIVVRDFSLGELAIGLAGRHQAANAAVALGILRALNRRGIAKIDEAAIRAGFAGATWPGRLEILHINGLVGNVILDGAHNAAGAAALAAALDDLRDEGPPRRATLVFGALRDKEVGRMIAALRSSAVLASAHVIATTVPDTPRALAADEVFAAWHGAIVDDAPDPDGAAPSSVEAIADADEALQRGISVARAAAGPLVVAGSLYLVGHVRGKLMPDPG